MSKRKVSVENKIYAVNLYLDGKESQQRIAHMFDVSLASVQQWIRNYESMGANVFTLKGNKKYSKELKQQAVVDYLAGYGSWDNGWFRNERKRSYIKFGRQWRKDYIKAFP